MKSYQVLRRVWQMGKNQSYKIIKSSKSQLTLEVINEIGSNFNFDMQKQNRNDGDLNRHHFSTLIVFSLDTTIS